MADRLARAARAATVASMVGYALAPPHGATRRLLASTVVGAMFATTLHATSRRWGRGRAATAAAVASIATLAAEVLGTRTAVPFGRYQYTGALRPTAWSVPLVVPLAWVAVSAPAREAAHAALGGRSTPATRIAAGALALTAWDLFLDPRMVRDGFWTWQEDEPIGEPDHRERAWNQRDHTERIARRTTHQRMLQACCRYRGIPLTNFAGWIAVGACVMAILEATLPPGEPDAALVGQYGGVAVMETLGFATFFDDRSVAVAGASAMLPVAVLAAARIATRDRA